MGLQTAHEIARSSRTDLYLGVVAPVGIRRESFHASLGRALAPFGYRLELVRMSELLRDFKDVHIDDSSEDARLRTAMEAGSRIRGEAGADVLARAAMLEVSSRRSGRTTDRPTAHVFWSLKHPEEVASLRLVYGGGFHLVGLFASEDERVRELQNRPGVDEAAARRHVSLDREEVGRDHGQRTRDTFHRADVFVAWGLEPNETALARFVDLLFGRPDLSPTLDEHCMFLAFGSALRSGELARQVGAALVSREGDVLALGANDVPKRGGGLYWPGDDDDRDATRGEDSNEAVRRDLLHEVAQELKSNAVEEFAQRLAKTRLKDITEYGRAVHAEMEALLACARTGRSTRGTTLYVTTYPCHNCARHIIAAGVERVVYIEPYPKSRALQLHDKDITELSPGGGGAEERVRFQPHLGVGPRRFFDYFSLTLGDGYELERKDGQGRLASWDKAAAAPRPQLSEVSFLELERNLADELLPYRVSEA